MNKPKYKPGDIVGWKLRSYCSVEILSISKDLHYHYVFLSNDSYPYNIGKTSSFPCSSFDEFAYKIVNYNKYWADLNK